MIDRIKNKIAENQIAYGIAAVAMALCAVNLLFPGLLPPAPAESMPLLAGIFGISFGKSSSNNVNSSASAGYDLNENIGQSGSEQGSTADSLGFNYSQSGQNIYGGQQPYINDIYANASNLFNNYALPEKNVAEINPALAAGLSGTYGFATGGGNDIYTAQLMNALSNMGGYGTASNAANLMAGGNVYSAPTTNGLNYATLAGAVNNPYLDGQIDAASRDVMRNLNENELTGNAALAAGTGNSGSSRRAVMDAIATRGAADRVGDISATMRGNAYSQGLGLANATALANLNASLGTNALNAGLMNNGANLAYNLGTAGSTGLRDAYTTGTANTGAMTDVGAYLRKYQQEVLDAAYSNEMNPYNSLGMYKSIIGDPTVLSSSNSLGIDTSSSNSFGNSFNNSYSYGMGGNTSSGSGTGSASSWNLGLNGGK